MKNEIMHLNPTRLTKLFIAGSRWLSKYADILNDLNVYPVPDGDTGTNMSMTLQSVENELMKVDHKLDMHELYDIVSEAVLLGARGNSGTILSQIIQGFLDRIKDEKVVSIEIVTEALISAKEKAYGAVSEPVEGTILTVIREVSEAAINYKGPKQNFLIYLRNLKRAAKKSVDHTPELLSKLKDAGVVDAGGMGLFYILEGFEKSLTDPDMLKDLERIIKSQVHRKEKLDVSHSKEDIKFKYCTEFIIESGSFDFEEYKASIMGYGDSMVCAQTDKKTKTHIHTNNPGLVLEIAGKLGSLNNMKIENMEIQHSHVLSHGKEAEEEKMKFIIDNKDPKSVAYFLIADNLELGNLFMEDGATAVLIGGQTKNPSVQEMEDVMRQIESERIVVLPNNKNIISAAKIAAERIEKNIIVLETKTMLEGHFILMNRADGLENALKQASFNNSIEITVANRNTKFEDIKISEGDYIAIVNGKIVDKNSDQVELIKKVYKKYINENTLNVFSVIGKNHSKDGDKAVSSVKDLKYREFFGNQENYPYYIYIEQRDPNLPEVAIVTDSASDLARDQIMDLPIEVVPLKVQIEKKTYQDGVDLKKKDFWHRLLTENIFPKTSQPSPIDIKNAYQKLFDKGYKKIISIHVSKKLSGTYQAVKIGRELTGREGDIEVVNSGTATFGLGHQVLEAAKMAKYGANFDEILRMLDDINDKMKLYFVVSDLKYLEKGGRIGKASSILGGILKVKPVLKIEDGEVTLETKTFGERGALSYIEKMIKNEGKKMSSFLYVASGGTSKEVEYSEELKRISENYKKIEYKGKFEIGPTIGSHTGPVYAIGLIPKIK